MAPYIATFFIFSAFLASEALSSIGVHLKSLANASAALVLPTPGLPDKTIAFSLGVPFFHKSAHLRNSFIARSLPTISSKVFGRYFSVQSTIFTI